jgi:hypothetical protein
MRRTDLAYSDRPFSKGTRRITIQLDEDTIAVFELGFDRWTVDGKPLSSEHWSILNRALRLASIHAYGPLSVRGGVPTRPDTGIRASSA